jgi:hypothetical protein
MLTAKLMRILGLGALVLTSASCGDVARTGRAPVYLVIDRLEGSAGGREQGEPSGTLRSDVQTLIVESPCSEESPCPSVFNDSGIVALRIVPKDIGVVAPSANNEVTIRRYRVVYTRADGRNTPGVDVPSGFEGGLTGTVPASGGVELGFELVRHVAKEQAPLAQLISSPRIITTTAEVTFYGEDRVGNDISVTGSILIEFGNFGD